MEKKENLILKFDDIFIKDVALVGGKNASLGEMYTTLSAQGINVPDGFATTSKAYWHFLETNKLLPKLQEILKKTDAKNVKSLQNAEKALQGLILKSDFPKDIKEEIIQSYKNLEQKYGKDFSVAVRSSATAEDLPTVSFAGQHESYLNIKGEKALLSATKKCIASLFNARAISYRAENKFDDLKVALSVGVQKMVRSDLACSGVMFTIDTETGFKNTVVINGSWGLGETIVKGRVVTDEFLVFKPTLGLFNPIISKSLGSKSQKLIYKGNSTKYVPVDIRDQKKFILNDEEIIKLAKWGKEIEEHYKMPMDIEWAKDGQSQELFIVQARPETIHGAKTGQAYKQYVLKGTGKEILQGEAVGSKIVSGKVKIIPDVANIKKFQKDEILVTRMTDPDWEPIMKIAKGIITEEGSRVCHAAIVSRELGIPCIVGAKNAMKALKDGQEITIDCSSGQKAKIYSGAVEFEIKEYNLTEIPQTKTKIMMNMSSPENAFANSFLPNSGVGLAREEFIINSEIKVHPMALYNFNDLKDLKLKAEIEKITEGYTDKKEYFINKLAQGVGKIAAAFYPNPVIVRFSDFKSNEYAELLGGKLYEPEESNPMIGWRGASRYYDEKFKPAFQLECKAIKRVREEFGLTNLKVMIPFCRTVEEGRKVIEIMNDAGLSQEEGLQIYVMCEIPSNVILAEEFLRIFDGMSIGSNDLTQLALGLDRDSGLIATIGDERNEAVKKLIKEVIAVCKKKEKYVGICGEAPSTFMEFAEFIVQEGIESMSLNPDTIVKTTLKIAEVEKKTLGNE